MRGAGRDRHERAVGCGGDEGHERRAWWWCTAESCGPDVAVLALSAREAKLLVGDGGKRAVRRGEHEVSRKAIAQGKPECLRWTCMLVCASLDAQWHTRPRVQRAPGFPCALFLMREQKKMQTSGISCR